VHMRIACWILQATNTHTSTATVIAEMRLSVTLYILCLSCLNLCLIML